MSKVIGGYKLYVIVDAFLDRSQQAVQAAHAVAAFCLSDLCKEKAQQWENKNIVLLKTKDIQGWEFRDVDARFHEPHWDNRLTAVAAFRQGGFADDLPFV